MGKRDGNEEGVDVSGAVPGSEARLSEQLTMTARPMRPTSALRRDQFELDMQMDYELQPGWGGEGGEAAEQDIGHPDFSSSLETADDEACPLPRAQRAQPSRGASTHRSEDIFCCFVCDGGRKEMEERDCFDKEKKRRERERKVNDKVKGSSSETVTGGYWVEARKTELRCNWWIGISGSNKATVDRHPFTGWLDGKRHSMVGVGILYMLLIRQVPGVALFHDLPPATLQCIDHRSYHGQEGSWW